MVNTHKVFQGLVSHLMLNKSLWPASSTHPISISKGAVIASHSPVEVWRWRRRLGMKYD